jgi:hypothetical protein
MKTKDHPRLLARNRKLIHRYLYWTEVERRRFDDVLHILEWEEFFIGQQTIMAVLRENPEMVEEEREKLINKSNSN